MKKQVFFYILWDVLFWVFMYGIVAATYTMKVYTGRTMGSFFPTLWANIGLLALLGGVFCLLAFVSGRFPHTIKSAIAEFILIGLPALYLATAFLLPALLHGIGIEGVVPILTRLLYRTSLPLEIGSIVFGYELFLLIARIFQIKKTTKQAVTGSEAAE